TLTALYNLGSTVLTSGLRRPNMPRRLVMSAASILHACRKAGERRLASAGRTAAPLGASSSSSSTESSDHSADCRSVSMRASLRSRDARTATRLDAARWLYVDLTNPTAADRSG